MRKGLFGLILLVLGPAFGPALAADPPANAPDPAADAQARARQMAAMCAQVVCRKASRTITLHLADGGNYTLHTSPYPYLDQAGNVVLYPGETITLGFSKTGDELGKPVLVAVRDVDGAVDIGAAQPAPAMTLSFSLGQDVKKPDTTLIAASTVGAMLKYDARVSMVVQGGVRLVNSNTCPLMPPQGNAPSFSGFENWPQAIGMMVISNIRALPPGTPVRC